MRPVNWTPMMEPGEVLIWSGQPYPALPLIAPKRAEWLCGALGAVLVAIVLVARRISPPDGSAMRLALVMGGLLGALFVAGIPFRAMRARVKGAKRLNYAVTNHRAMIVDAANPAAFQQFRLPQGATPVVEAEPHGLYTLHMGADPAGRPSPRFVHLRDADGAANLIRMAVDEDNR